MKKVFTIAIIAVSAIFAVSCAKEIASVDQPSTTVKEGTPFSIRAITTKTAVNNTQSGVVWVENDAMNVFHAPASTTSYVNEGEFDWTEGSTFEGTVSGALSASNDWYAIYPYKAQITTPAATSGGYQYIGSRSDQSQTQNGNNSMAHLAGQNYPLYGVTKGVAENTTPSFVMEQLSSIVAVKVTNTTSDPLTVNSVSFTGTENIVGTFYVDFTGANPSFTDATYVSSTANLTVNNAAALNKDAYAVYYLAVKPFSATSGQTLTVSVNGYEKDIDLTKDVTFAHGKIKTINFDYDGAVKDPVYTLSFPRDANASSYTATHNVVSGGITWSVYGNQSIGNYLRMGGKNTTATDRTVTAQGKMAARVEKVVVNHLGIGNGSNSSITVNSVSLKVSNTTSFASPLETVTLSSPSVSSSGKLEFVPSSEPWDSGKYYQIVVNYQISGSNNCYLTIDNVCFYGEAAAIPTPTLSSIAVKTAPTKVSYTEGEYFNPAGLVITKTMSDSSTENVAYSGHESDFTFSPSLTTALTTSDANVTITYGGKNVNQAITVLEAGIAPLDDVITLANGVGSGSGTTYTIVWSGTSCTIQQTKEGSNTNVNSSYIAAPRWYQSHKIAFKAKAGYTITGATVVCTTNAYATELKNSTYSTGASAKVNNSTVTITSSGDFDITMGAQARISTITVHYTVNN